MSGSLESRRWDQAYKDGKYENDPPITFVDTILEELGEEGKKKFGMYVGCGNGRNFIPLLDVGLNIRGIDVSPEAISQIKKERPSANVWVAPFSNDIDSPNGLLSANVWDYLISIHVFQHGDKKTVDGYFAKTHTVLKPGGKLFLRVNSISTEVDKAHQTVERKSKNMGRTILYTEGEKEGMKIHFFTERELGIIVAKYNFEVIKAPEEVVESRKPPETGTWTQWETIWSKVD
jgi:SAM-dependent methyltransferase